MSIKDGLINQIHRVVVEIPMSFAEIRSMVFAEDADIKDTLAYMRKTNILEIDGQGRYVPARRVSADDLAFSEISKRLSV